MNLVSAMRTEQPLNRSCLLDLAGEFFKMHGLDSGCLRESREPEDKPTDKPSDNEGKTNGEPKGKPIQNLQTPIQNLKHPL